MQTLTTDQCILAIICSSSALLLAGWTLFMTLGHRGLPGCGTKSACHAVTTGRWSRIGPIPVAFLGVIIYALLTASIVGNWIGKIRIPGIITLESMAGWCCIGAAIWFTFVQAIVIRRLCAYCLATHLLATLAAILLFLSINKESFDTGVMIAGPAVLFLIAAQMVWQPKLYAITKTRDMISKTGESIQTVLPKPEASMPTEAMLAPTSNARKHRTIELHSGDVKFDIFDFPLIGSPDATNILAAFIDFTCTECHHLHRLLYSAINKYPKQIAVTIIPIPLHEGCNPTVKCHQSEQALACNFARLAWRIWRANPEVFAQWDTYLIEPEENRPFGLAWLQGKSLANIAELKPGEPDAFSNSKIAISIQMFGISPGAKVPSVLLDHGILTGHVNDLNDLMHLIGPYLIWPENSPVDGQSIVGSNSPA